MKNKPLVSVIMPVYNGEKYLREAIKSILNQTYKNFELLIIDDGSKDKSIEIIEEYKKKDKRIRFFKNKKNRGTFKNYNYLIKNFAKGKYIAIQEQDDVSLKNRLQSQVVFLENNPDIILVGSHINIINSRGEIIGKRFYPLNNKEIKKQVLLKSPFANPTILIKKDAFLYGGAYGDYITAGDYDLWIRLVSIKEYKTANLNKFLVNYRIHEYQQKLKRLKIQLKETINIQKKYIFKKKYLSIFALLNHFLLRLLYFLPDRIVLWLFKKVEFRDIN